MADLPERVAAEQVDFVRVEQADDGSWKWVAFDYQARPVAERRDFRKLHKARTSAKVVFPGKQVLRPGCRVCKAPLWGEKTRFCSRDCAQRLANWKRPQKAAVAKFLRAVEEPMWLERPSQKPVSAADGVHFVSRIDRYVLVRNGRIIAWGNRAADGEPSALDRDAAERRAERSRRRRAEQETWHLRRTEKVGVSDGC